MNLKKRFFLLFVICLAFVVLATGVMAFAQGYTFNFQTKKIIATGTLIVNSDPKGAEIYLNGRFTGKTTPSTLRLIPPGEYDLGLKKTDYDEYQKHLTILPKQVVSVAAQNGKITLFLAKPLPRLVSENAFDIFSFSSQAWYASATSTVNLQAFDYRHFLASGLPKPLPGENLQISSDVEWAALIENAALKLISNLVSGESLDFKGFNLHFSAFASLGPNELLLKDKNGRLYQYGLREKILKLRRESVQAYAVQSEEIFFLDGGNLYATNHASTTIQTLARGLPENATGSLIPAEKKGLFAQLNGSLYQINSQPQLLAGNVNEAYWDAPSQTLVFHNPHNVWTFRPGSDTAPELVVRTSGDLQNPIINLPAGQMFFLEAGRVKSVELYGSSSRKTVEFPNDAGPVKKFQINPEGTIIYALVSGKGVYQTQIR